MKPLWVLCVMSCLLVLATVALVPARGDTLVTNGGSRYTGKVVEDGDGYRVTLADGGEITFPKSAVKEVLKGDPASEAAQEAGIKAQAALKPLRDKVNTARRSVSASLRAAKARQQKEIEAGVSAEDQAAVEKVRSAAKSVEAAVAKLGKPAPGPPTPGIKNEVAIAVSVSVTMPDGSKRTFFATPKNAASVVAEARNMVAAMKEKARKNSAARLAPAHKKELDQHTALLTELRKADDLLKGAVASIAAVSGDEVKTAAELAKYEKEIDGRVQAVVSGLKKLTAGGEPPKPAADEPPAHKPSTSKGAGSEAVTKPAGGPSPKAVPRP